MYQRLAALLLSCTVLLFWAGACDAAPANLVEARGNDHPSSSAGGRSTTAGQPGNAPARRPAYNPTPTPDGWNADSWKKVTSNYVGGVVPAKDMPLYMTRWNPGPGYAKGSTGPKGPL
ncbi:hypothetical protein CDD83_8194 [Cordyceps sp. RAO-2017]|nr:hypothetical protein CDD83_8194 [Cordyceps sp. RAO-2017]